MAIAARGEVTLCLGAATFVLRPTFGVVCEIEDAIGTTLFDVGRKLELAEITARDLVTFAHACLAACGHSIARDELADAIVTSGTHQTITTLVEFCRNYAFGGQQEKKAENVADGQKAATAMNTCEPA